MVTYRRRIVIVETKKVVILDGEIINVGEMDEMPEGATLGEREMIYSLDNGWREVGWNPPIPKTDILESKLEYLAFMSGVELFE